MKKRDNLNLVIISQVLSLVVFMLTISEPIAPLKPLPPSEYVSCETMQLT